MLYRKRNIDLLVSHFALKRNLVTRKCCPGYPGWPANRDDIVNFQPGVTADLDPRGFGPPRIWTPRSRSASGFGPPGPNPLADMDPLSRIKKRTYNASLVFKIYRYNYRGKLMSNTIVFLSAAL